MPIARTRPAQPADAATILELVVSMTREVVGHSIPPEMERTLRAEVSAAVRGDPGDHLIVAERDGRPVGCGRVRLLDYHPMLRFGATASHAYIELMYVAPDDRGTGTADAILAALEAWASAHGVNDVTLHHTPQARRFYERHGYAPLGEMHKRLVTGRGSTSGAPPA